jgi:hypothetical protein
MSAMLTLQRLPVDSMLTITKTAIDELLKAYARFFSAVKLANENIAFGPANGRAYINSFARSCLDSLGTILKK